MTPNQLVTSIMPQEGRHMGDLVGWSITGTVRQDEAIRLAESHGLADDFGFPRVTANSAYRRAVRAAVRGARDEARFEVVKVEDSPTKIVHAIVRRAVERGTGGGALSPFDAEFEQQTKVGFDKDGYAGKAAPETLLVLEHEAHPIAQRVRTEYVQLCCVFRAEDVRVAFQRAFRRWGAARLLDHGGVWWVPSTHAVSVRAWEEYMAALDWTALVLPVFDTKETIASLREITTQSLEGNLLELQEQLEHFAGKDTTRVSTLEARVEEFDSLRDRAELYERLLGHTLDDLKQRAARAQESLVRAIAQVTQHAEGR